MKKISFIMTSILAFYAVQAYAQTLGDTLSISGSIPVFPKYTISIAFSKSSTCKKSEVLGRGDFSATTYSNVSVGYIFTTSCVPGKDEERTLHQYNKLLLNNQFPPHIIFE